MREIKSMILIADIETQYKRIMRQTLNKAGYKVIEARTGKEVLRLTHSVRPELIMLDLQFSDVPGINIIKKVRESMNIPIITLVDHADNGAILDAFDAGADDFVGKPFNTCILAAKVHASLRRSIIKESSGTKLVIGNIILDQLKHEVKVQGQKVFLSPKEYQLLSLFMSNQGKILTHNQILTKIWGPSNSYNTQYLRVYVAQLRKKIDSITKSSHIVTEAGIGYRMDDAA